METLKTECHGPVLLVRLDRPRRRNAINMTLLDELEGTLSRAETDRAIRAVVVTGTDQAFSAGQDLKEPEADNFVARINEVFNRLETLPKPTIAAISGWCIAGGLELALTCDIRICSRDARIGDWHARINSIGGAGATVRLVRTVGISRAKEIVFTGKAMSGEEAREYGLVSHVHGSDELVDKAIELATAMCIGDPLTVHFAKKSLNAAGDLNLRAALEFSLLCQNAVRAELDRDYTERFGDRNRGTTGEDT